MSHPGICHLNIGIHISLQGLVIQIQHILEVSERTVWRKFEYWRSNNIEGAVWYPSQFCMQFSKCTYMHGQPSQQLVSHIFTDTSIQVGVEVIEREVGRLVSLHLSTMTMKMREKRGKLVSMLQVLWFDLSYIENRKERDLCGHLPRSSVKGQSWWQ